MTTILTPVIRRKGMNEGAFRGILNCPGLITTIHGKTQLCGANKWKYVEKLGLYRVRYRCTVCGRTIQYDFTNNPGHPYGVFGKNKWQRIVDTWKKKGKHPKGIIP